MSMSVAQKIYPAEVPRARNCFLQGNEKLEEVLLDQNRFITEEDQSVTTKEEINNFEDTPLLAGLALMMRINPVAFVVELSGKN